MMMIIHNRLQSNPSVILQLLSSELQQKGHSHSKQSSLNGQRRIPQKPRLKKVLSSLQPAELFSKRLYLIPLWWRKIHSCQWYQHKSIFQWKMSHSTTSRERGRIRLCLRRDDDERRKSLVIKCILHWIFIRLSEHSHQCDSEGSARENMDEWHHIQTR